VTAIDTDLLVVEGVKGPAFDQLAKRMRIDHQPDLWTDRDRLFEAASRTRALVVRNRTQVDAALLEAAPQLRVVGRAGVGLDNIDLAAADRAGVVVVAARGANAQSVAEHTVALALALARNVAVHDRATRLGHWNRSQGFELAGRTWGLLGAGATGRAVGSLVSCFGSRVIGYDTTVTAGNAQLLDAGIELVSLDRLIEESDVISIHLPATAETRNLVDRDFLRRMRSSALLINVGRGEVVDESALVEALTSGQLAGAGLDVRASEPPTPGLLETLDNVVLTPHVAGMTDEAQDRIVAMLASDIETLLSGGTALNAVGALSKLPAVPQASLSEKG
jgi:D-3-phosphoglycerate dehydrogenase / 2-oxoglutarate reductase